MSDNSNRHEAKADTDAQADFIVVGVVKAAGEIEKVSGKNGKTYEKRSLYIDYTSGEYDNFVSVEFFQQELKASIREVVVGDFVRIRGVLATRVSARGMYMTTAKGLSCYVIRRSNGRVSATGKKDPTPDVGGKYDDSEELAF